MNFYVRFNNPNITDEDIDSVVSCLKTGAVSTSGPVSAEFEHAFSSIAGGARSIALCSGTAAIQLALLAMGLERGEGVLVPSLTYVSSASPVLNAGGIPFFADSDPATCNMDLALLDEWIDSRTEPAEHGLIHTETGIRIGFILAVHLLGNAMPGKKLKKFAETRRLKVIEDAAQALGARTDGRLAGAWGEAGCFSFNGNKMITSAAGGMLVSRDPELMDRVEALARPAGSITAGSAGYNYRMPAMLAALGMSQLGRLDDHVARTRAVVAEYRRELAGLPGFTFPRFEPDGGSTGWAAAVHIHGDKTRLSRDELIRVLADEGIEARPSFPPLHLTEPFASAGVPCSFSNAAGDGRLPGAESIAADLLLLPSGAGLGNEARDYVIKTIRSLALNARR